MTATDELRRLLDERGAEWTYGDGTVSFSDGKHWCHAWAYNDDTMCVSMGYFTPEQAIEATLGRGECEVVKGTGHGPTAGTKSSCSECGGVMNARDRYCRWCGRKVRA